MTVLVAWVVFPVVLLAIALGNGLLVQRISGAPVPGSLILPVGVAAMIVLAQVPVVVGLPGLTTPLLVVSAAAGALVSRPWKRGRLRWWPIGAAMAVFAVYAAPVVLSGDATFAGYIKLDDTSTWLAITDQVMERGLDTSSLPPSTYEATIALNLGAGYPFGVFLPLGVGHQVVGVDAAWLFQPYLALLAALLSLALWRLAGEAVERPWLRAVIAFVAAQPALLYGYYLWGGVKEVAAAMLLATSVALLAPLLRDRSDIRSMVPAACAIAALGAVLTPAGLVWLLPALGLLAGLLWLRSRRPPLRPALALAAPVAMLLIPLFATGTLAPAVSDPLTDSAALGNLIAPLKLAQIVGIWPVGDFRLSPDDTLVTAVLIGIAVLAAGWGLVVLVSRRRLLPLIYVAGVLAGSLALYALGSPWNGGKALAAASPALLLAAGIGIAALLAGGRRFEAAVFGGLIVAGVLWSNALAYREVWLAPRGQLVELEEIGEEFAGQGPTLMTEYQPYGVRHFLRRADPEGASELRRRTVPLAGGGTLEKGEFADTDELALGGLLVYRTLVLRRSPSQSRPPSPYALRRSGDFYEVWQRPPGGGRQGLIEHMGLGTGLDPGAVPDCDRVIALAERAPPGARLLAAVAPPLRFLSLGDFPRPADWATAPEDPRLVTPQSSGDLRARVEAAGGEYEFWLGGSVSGSLELRVDGAQVAGVRGQLNNDGQYVSLGQGTLREGGNELLLRYSAGGWHPGSEVPQEPLGPLVLRPVLGAEPILSAAPAAARRLCGRRLDWIELVEG